MVIGTGGRVVLRDMALKDVEAWGHWMGPGQQWRELDGPYYQNEPTAQWLEEAIAKLRERLSGETKLPDIRERAAITLRNSDELIGQVSRYWISQETNWAALGIVIYDPENWGQGYGHEALGLWSQYQFDNEPSFARLDVRTWSGNAGMIRLADKLGFQQEARFRRARIVKGAYYDGLGYGVLRDEWEARYPDGFA